MLPLLRPHYDRIIPFKLSQYHSNMGKELDDRPLFVLNMSFSQNRSTLGEKKTRLQIATSLFLPEIEIRKCFGVHSSFYCSQTKCHASDLDLVID